MSSFCFLPIFGQSPQLVSLKKNRKSLGTCSNVLMRSVKKLSNILICNTHNIMQYYFSVTMFLIDSFSTVFSLRSAQRAKQNYFRQMAEVMACFITSNNRGSSYSKYLILNETSG